MASNSDLMAQVRKRTTTSADCPSHPGQDAVFICKETACNESLACMKCVTSNHLGHKMADLAQYAASKKEMFKNKIETGKESILNLLLQNIKSTEQKITENKTKTRDDQDKIIQRCNELKAELDKICQKYTESRKETGDENERNLTTHKGSLETLYTQYKAELEECETAVDEGSDSEIVKLTERNFPASPKVPALPEIDDAEFTFSDISSKQLEELFGKLSVRKESLNMATSVPAGEHGATALPLQNIQQFVVKRNTPERCNYIHSSSDQLYVWFNGSRTISLVNKHGKVTSTVTLQPGLDEKYQIQGVCVSPVDGTLWSLCYNVGTILQVKQDGTLLQSFKQKCPAIIYVTHRKLVLVGITGHGQVIVKVYSVSGKLTRTLSKNDIGIGACPKYIAQCQKTGRVAMAGNKAVSVLDKEYKRLYILHGETVTTIDNKTKPTGYKTKEAMKTTGICFDRDGGLLVCDINNRSVILFSSSGQYIRTIIQEADKDKCPCAIDTAPDGTLWVAHENDVFKQIKYK